MTAPRDPRPELRVGRPNEAEPADEITMLRGWLKHLRESAMSKLDGVDRDGLRWKPAPTANSLGGIVIHLGHAERYWLREVFAGDVMPPGWREHQFVVPDGWTADDVVASYRAAIAVADAALDAAPSLDAQAASTVRPTTLRWIVTHLVEELARHCGHLDITRELLDGSTGR